MQKEINKKKIIIVGAGITGLSAAYICAKAGHEVVLLDSSDRPGGLLSTFSIGNTNLEKFYHHFFTHDKELLWLIDELGLTSKVEFKKTTMGVYRDGVTFNFNKITDLLKFTPFNIVDIFRFGLSSIYLTFFSDWKKLENVPALEWLEKYSGKKVTDVLWKPLINGKFGPYATILPISWLIGRLSQRFKSRNSGGELLGYLDGSLKILVDKLIEKLKDLNITFELNFLVSKAEFENNKISYVTDGKKLIYGDIFIFATPTNITSKILNKDKELSSKLSKIEYFGAVCVVLELKDKFSDIYWTNIADDSSPFVGIIEQTNLVDPLKYGGSHVIYLSKYFSNDDEFYAKSSEQKIAEEMINYLPKIKKGFEKSEIKSLRVFRSPYAAVVCDLNFSSKVPKYKTSYINAYISSIVHVYPDERSANNSIRVAKEVCNQCGIDTSYIPIGPSLAGELGK